MSDDVKKILTTDVVRGGGVFHWDEHRDEIARVNFRGAASLPAKQMHMVGLFELACDLCIDSVANVSSNPGFETCLGAW
jgi:hypothetical protein